MVLTLGACGHELQWCKPAEARRCSFCGDAGRSLLAASVAIRCTRDMGQKLLEGGAGGWESWWWHS